MPKLSDDHLTIGDVVAAMEKLPPNKALRWSLKYPKSYRGYYEDLAVSCDDYPYLVWEQIAEIDNWMKTFEGYKGGSFKMTLETAVWVAAYGDCGFPLTEGFLKLVIG
jgi:hypothetical protein